VGVPPSTAPALYCSLLKIWGLGHTAAKLASVSNLHPLPSPSQPPGGQDRLADPADVSLLLSELSPGCLAARHHDPDYAHLDYLWGINAPQRIYNDVMRLLAEGRAVRDAARAGLARKEPGEGQAGGRAAAGSEARGRRRRQQWWW
jgi:hypothetical protein